MIARDAGKIARFYCREMSLYVVNPPDYNGDTKKKGASRDTLETPTYVTELVGYQNRRWSREFVSIAALHVSPPLE